MLIKAATKIKNKYKEVSDLCKETGEPIYLIENGEADLVVMDVSAFEHLQKTYKVSDELERFHKSKLNIDDKPTPNEQVEDSQE